MRRIHGLKIESSYLIYGHMANYNRREAKERLKVINGRKYNIRSMVMEY